MTTAPPTGPALVYEASGQIVAIGDGLTIGRDTASSLHIPDPTVSKHHAQIARSGEAFVLLDLRSTNGTFVNGMQIVQKVLADGDHVRFGTVAFRFRATVSDVLEPRALDRRMTSALEALRKLSAETLAIDNERIAVRAVSDFLLDLLAADRVFAAFSARESGKDKLDLAMVRTRRDLDPKRATVPVAQTPMLRAIRTKRTFCPSTEAKDYAATSASVRAASLGSVLVVPLVARGRVLGAIQAERFDGSSGPFDEVDVLTGELAANLLASAVEAARLHRQAAKAPEVKQPREE